MAVFESATTIEVPAAEAFRWHKRPGAFLRLSPPWDRFGSPPFSARCVHEQVFEDAGAGRSVVVDRINYPRPFGSVGEFVGATLTRRSLERLFRHRATVAAGDLSRHAPYFSRAPLRIAITGASGLVGRQLAAFLTAGGHEVVRVARGRIDHEALEGLDAFIHLAGENIAAGRWTEERKAEILASRVEGTRLLAVALSVLRKPPEVFLSASAIGYYGDRGEERVDETAPAGVGFLADVARAWESATEPAEAAGIRTVKMRFGVILTARGGALAKMLLPFRLGAGGPIGSGRQGFSWIALDDAIYAMYHLIRHDDLRGPVNVVAPDPLSQREFARALGRALRRPAFTPLPACAVKALFGQMGEELLLRGQFVEPAALRRSGFAWSAARLPAALAR